MFGGRKISFPYTDNHFELSLFPVFGSPGVFKTGRLSIENNRGKKRDLKKCLYCRVVVISDVVIHRAPLYI